METNKTKHTRLLIITVVIALVAAIAAIIYISGSSGRDLKKQLDLGHKYLLEQNYEQAIVCFKKAIEIDPMCEDAYLSMADAYVGIEDFDNAISLLEEAIKLFEDNGLDATALKDKLAKVQAEKERLEKEKAEEEERKRIAELPYIEIQPILDCLDNVWGRKWTSWTMEDYINEFNLEHHTNNGHEWWADGPGSRDYCHEARPYENSSEIFQWGKKYKGGSNSAIVSISFEKDGTAFCQYIKSSEDNDERLVKDYLYTYTSKNGIESVETAKKLWGIEKDGAGEINTDFGIGRVWSSKEAVAIGVNEYDIGITEYDGNDGAKTVLMSVFLRK